MTIPRILTHWGKVCIGNFAGALTTSVLTVIVFTYGFSTEPGEIAAKLSHVGDLRTIGNMEHGLGGWATNFTRQDHTREHHLKHRRAPSRRYTTPCRTLYTLNFKRTV